MSTNIHKPGYITFTYYINILLHILHSYITNNMSNTSTFMSAQIEASKNKGEFPDKKKKKKKMSAYKKLLRSIKTSSKTEEQKKEGYKKKLSKSLGGGTFNKIDSI